mmetsp:Transcript_25332/g.46250  ORF Transcript_25332/g.46250 Transcript_25332/m.46250 type:complete len:224 (+) Transcript_25332:252-923(+)
MRAATAVWTSVWAAPASFATLGLVTAAAWTSVRAAASFATAGLVTAAAWTSVWAVPASFAALFGLVPTAFVTLGLVLTAVWTSPRIALKSFAVTEVASSVLVYIGTSWSYFVIATLTSSSVNVRPIGLSLPFFSKNVLKHNAASRLSVHLSRTYSTSTSTLLFSPPTCCISSTSACGIFLEILFVIAMRQQWLCCCSYTQHVALFRRMFHTLLAMVIMRIMMR